MICEGKKPEIVHFVGFFYDWYRGLLSHFHKTQVLLGCVLPVRNSRPVTAGDILMAGEQVKRCHHESRE